MFFFMYVCQFVLLWPGKPVKNQNQIKKFHQYELCVSYFVKCNKLNPIYKRIRKRENQNTKMFQVFASR